MYCENSGCSIRVFKKLALWESVYEIHIPFKSSPDNSTT